MVDNEEKKKMVIVIGNGEDHAGIFNEDKKTISLVVILKGYLDAKKEQHSDMFERMALMIGSIYEKVEKAREDIYTLECFKIKQLEILAPMIAKIYSDYKWDVEVIIDKSCYEFLK